MNIYELDVCARLPLHQPSSVLQTSPLFPPYPLVSLKSFWKTDKVLL